MPTLAMSAVRATGATATFRASRPRAVSVRRVVAPPAAPTRRVVVVKASPETRDLGSPSLDAFVVPGEPSYPGMYADWSVTKADAVEVWSYRACLTTVALTTLACASPLVFGEGAIGDLTRDIQQPAYFLGGLSLGAALFLIHMYVDPIKKFMQALWAIGFAGSLGIALTTHESVPSYVAHHPSAVWFVGPMFAAFTGVAFKEGACYGNPECAALFFIVPLTLLGHLSGGVGEAGEVGLISAWCVLITVFASRKFTQAVKDDIGDKSVFVFNAMSDAQRDAWLRQTKDADPRRYARLIQEQR
jgi:uncharacterized integral membrane protein